MQNEILSHFTNLLFLCVALTAFFLGLGSVVYVWRKKENKRPSTSVRLPGPLASGRT